MTRREQRWEQAWREAARECVTSGHDLLQEVAYDRGLTWVICARCDRLWETREVVWPGGSRHWTDGQLMALAREIDERNERRRAERRVEQ